MNEAGNLSKGTSVNAGVSAKDANPNMARCSLCGTIFDRCDAKWMPFCSYRCKEIDLGNWLSESYGLTLEDRNPAESSVESQDP
jgi:hypothetical protein